MDIPEVKDRLDRTGAYRAARAVFDEGNVRPPYLSAVAVAMADSHTADEVLGTEFSETFRIVMDPVISMEGLQKCLTRPLVVEGDDNLWAKTEATTVSPQTRAAATSAIAKGHLDAAVSRDMNDMDQLDLNDADRSIRNQLLGWRITVLPLPHRGHDVSNAWVGPAGELAWSRLRDDSTLPSTDSDETHADLGQGLAEYALLLKELTKNWGGHIMGESVLSAHRALIGLLVSNQRPQDHVSIARELFKCMPDIHLQEAWRNGPFLAPEWRGDAAQRLFFSSMLPYEAVDLRTAALLRRQSEIRASNEGDYGEVGEWELEREGGRVLVHPDQAGNGFLTLSRFSPEGSTRVIGVRPDWEYGQNPRTLLPLTAIAGRTLLLDPMGRRLSWEGTVRALQAQVGWTPEKYQG
ncbi:MAG: hypothetical protein WC777_01745 [Candidatus Gracilibacteria bacterium]|jgi:hypothetical protein